MTKAVILNDTSKKRNRHVGCVAVMDAYHRLLASRGIKVIGTQAIGMDWRSLENRRMMDRADIVLVNGEGSIHDDKHTRLLNVGKHYPAILMNCVFQRMTKRCFDELSSFRLVAVRETFSANYMADTHGVRPMVVPDLIFSMDGGERTASSGRYIGDSVVSHGTGTEPQMDDPQFIEKFIRHKDACLGRFHAIALAAIFGVPFSAWRSNTWKNEAIMRDMGVPNLYAHDISDAIRLVPRVVSDSVREYVVRAKLSINDLFDSIANDY